MQTAVGSDLRADRQNLSLEAYDFTMKPVASEMRPYHSCRSSSSKSLPSSRHLPKPIFEHLFELTHSPFDSSSKFWIGRGTVFGAKT